MIAIVAIISLTACEEDYDVCPVKPTPVTDTTTIDTTHTTTPADPTYSSVVRQSVVVNPDTTVRSTTIVELTDKSHVTRELSFKLGMLLEGPSYLVVKDPAATVYNGTTGAPTTTEGNWYLVGKDSLKNVTTTSGFRFSYYQMSVSTTNKAGYSLIGGKWVSYLEAYLTTTAHRFSSVWEEEEIVRNDSIFRRERTTNEFNVTARWDSGSRSFILSKVVIIDHFVKMVEPEEPEVTPTPETQTTVNANFWANQLLKFISGTRVQRENGSWADAYLFETTDTYEIILVNYQTNSKDEKYLGTEQISVSKSISPYSAKYNGVMYSGGNFYPAVITVDGSGWTLVGVANGKTLTQTHNDDSAVSTGIKNFAKNNTAKPTPFITTTTDPSTVNGKMVIKFTGKTSVHTVTYTIADLALKK